MTTAALQFGKSMRRVPLLLALPLQQPTPANSSFYRSILAKGVDEVCVLVWFLISAIVTVISIIIKVHCTC